MWSATRSLGLLPAPFRNSAFARISQPVASDKDFILNRGVQPIKDSIPTGIGAGMSAMEFRLSWSSSRRGMRYVLMGRESRDEDGAPFRPRPR